MVMSIYEKRGIEKGKRAVLMRQMELKFGSVPESVRLRLENITDREELDLLASRILFAESLEEMWSINDVAQTV